jgi:hypothetical protein
MCCFVIEYEWLLHKTKICDTNINFKSGGWEIDFFYKKKKKKKIGEIAGKIGTGE